MSIVRNLLAKPLNRSYNAVTPHGPPPPLAEAASQVANNPHHMSRPAVYDFSELPRGPQLGTPTRKLSNTKHLDCCRWLSGRGATGGCHTVKCSLHRKVHPRPPPPTSLPSLWGLERLGLRLYCGSRFVATSSSTPGPTPPLSHLPPYATSERLRI